MLPIFFKYIKKKILHVRFRGTLRNAIRSLLTILYSIVFLISSENIIAFRKAVALVRRITYDVERFVKVLFDSQGTRHDLLYLHNHREVLLSVTI